MIAKTPAPPYYAVIFTSTRSETDLDYLQMAQTMESLVKDQEGYLGHESAREGLGITVSYWKSLAAIRKWKMDSEHLLAQQYGREMWYTAYKTRIALVERDYAFEL